MKFDTIIIGGGLSGLFAGITLAKAHQRVALVCNGQSTLHFNSGSFDLLGYDEQETEVTNPLEAIARIGKQHPYSTIGALQIAGLAQEAKELFIESGIRINGDTKNNHYRITPMGHIKPTWLSIDGFATLKNSEKLPWQKVAIVNIESYLDFPVHFLAKGLTDKGVQCTIKNFTIDELKDIRRSPSEMRATNIAKVLSKDNAIQKIADEINKLYTDADVILLPAVLGISNNETIDVLRKAINTPIELIATLPPSVSGVFVEKQLKQHFQDLGGILLAGDRVKEGEIDAANSVVSVQTANLPNTPLEADNFILATGSFMSGGIVADYQKIYEPIFGLDVDADAERENWYKESTFDAQPYMQFGVSYDQNFNAIKQGKSIHNLYTIGSILSGHNPLKHVDGTGVSILTALRVAKNILS